jgi:hypothetical protein
MHDSIFLYSMKAARPTGDRRCDQDWSPSFDPDGKYLYFLSQPHLQPDHGPLSIRTTSSWRWPALPGAAAGDVSLALPSERPRWRSPAWVKRTRTRTAEDDDEDADGRDRPGWASSAASWRPRASPRQLLPARGDRRRLLYLRKRPSRVPQVPDVTTTPAARLDLYKYDLDDERDERAARRHRQLPHLRRRQEAGLPGGHRLRRGGRRASANRGRRQGGPRRRAIRVDRDGRSSSRSSTRPGASSATGSTTRTCTAWTGRHARQVPPVRAVGAAPRAT